MAWSEPAAGLGRASSGLVVSVSCVSWKPIRRPRYAAGLAADSIRSARPGSAATAEQGVVDADLKVFGVSNVYVVSSSTFVTSGQANSTFMVVAFAVRLADQLADELSMAALPYRDPPEPAGSLATPRPPARGIGPRRRSTPAGWRAAVTPGSPPADRRHGHCRGGTTQVGHSSGHQTRYGQQRPRFGPQHADVEGRQAGRVAVELLFEFGHGPPVRVPGDGRRPVQHCVATEKKPGEDLGLLAAVGAGATLRDEGRSHRARGPHRAGTPCSRPHRTRAADRADCARSRYRPAAPRALGRGPC